MGYDISDIRSAANGYIVEGDILLTQRHLDEFESRVQTRQNFNQYWLTVSKDNQKIQINSAFPYVDFSLDCLDAIQYWNEKSQCSIVLSGAGGNSIIDIITEPFKTVDGYEDFNTLMLVTPPTSDGYPGSIKINSQSSYLPKPSTEQAKYMILHAVGHAIGFTHTLRDPNDGGDQSPEEYGVLIEGYGTCNGYADAMAIFLDKLNVINYKISNEEHIWNLVYLDGKWYHLDLTWDDPISDINVNRDTYFLITTNTLEKINDGTHKFDKSIYIEAKD